MKKIKARYKNPWSSYGYKSADAFYNALDSGLIPHNTKKFKYWQKRKAL